MSSRDLGLSYAGLVILGIVVVVFATFISTTITSTFISIINTTALLTNESATYTVDNYTVAVGLPSNLFARDVVNGLTWLLVGVLKLIADPFTFALLVILTLAIIALGTRLT
jgi:hypothetical protein